MSEQMKQRCDELFKLGLKWNGEYYHNPKMGIAVHHTDMLCSNDEEWKKVIEEVNKGRKQYAEAPLSETERMVISEAIKFYIQNNKLAFDIYDKFTDVEERVSMPLQTV